MDTSNIVDFASRGGISDGLTDLLRTGAQQLIASAVEAELEGFLAQFATARTAAGHAAVGHMTATRDDHSVKKTLLNWDRPHMAIPDAAFLGWVRKRV